MTDVLTAPAPQRGPTRRRGTWIAGAIIVVLLAAGIPTGVWFAHWRTSWHPLVAYSSYGVSIDNQPVGQGLYYGDQLVDARVIEHPGRREELSLRVTSIRPVVEENTSGARVVVLRCTLAGNADGPLGTDRSGAIGRCSALTPFRSGVVRLGFERGDDDIVVAVTPTRAGRVHVAGVEVSYRAGLRSGTEHTGGEASLTTRG